jgi:hypothetical protein
MDDARELGVGVDGCGSVAQRPIGDYAVGAIDDATRLDCLDLADRVGWDFATDRDTAEAVGLRRLT